MISTERLAELAAVAQALLRAEDDASPLSRVSALPWQVARDEAYLVQLDIANLRRARGEVSCGFKVGLTSAGMQTQLGVDEPDFGHLFTSMRVESSSPLDRGQLIRPRGEPELAIVFSSDLAGEVTVQDVRAAVGGVAVAIEVVDSRVRDWDISWTDTVADNGSSSRFVLGELADPSELLSFSTRTASLEKNGELVAAAPLTEVMGDPLAAVVWLARTLERFGERVHAGDVVLTGSPVKSVDLDAGDRVVAAIDGLGEVVLTMAEDLPEEES